MNLNTIILSIRGNLLSNTSLAILYYYFVNKDMQYRENLDSSSFEGEIEAIAYSSFMDEYVMPEELEMAFQLVRNKRFSKLLNIYHIIGVELQAKKQNHYLFQTVLKNYFQSHSLKYKYLIQKTFPEYTELFLQSLKMQPLSRDSNIGEKLLQYIYLQKEFTITKVLQEIESINDIDIPLLIILEEFSKIKASAYENERKKLQESLIWTSSEIQSKHKIYNNNEDQFNSVFHTIMSRDFKVENQSQRGETLSGKSFGELDVEVFTKSGYPLSIIEGFIISSIKKKYISDHLIKLTRKYDPNGLKQNFAIIYAKHKDFPLFWNRYQKFVSSFQFPHKMISSGLIDISDNYPPYANIRIGLTEHESNGNHLEVYHLFINSKFE